MIQKMLDLEEQLGTVNEENDTLRTEVQELKELTKGLSPITRPQRSELQGSEPNIMSRRKPPTKVRY